MFAAPAHAQFKTATMRTPTVARVATSTKAVSWPSRAVLRKAASRRSKHVSDRSVGLTRSSEGGDLTHVADRRQFLVASARNVALTSWGAFACVPRASTGRTVSVAPTKPDFSSLAGFCEGAQPLTRDDHAAHVARLQGHMQAGGIATMIVEPGPTQFHLSGVRWWPSERAFLMIVPQAGTPWWVCPAFERDRAEERAGSGADIRVWHEHDDPYALVAKGLGPGPVAVDPGMRHFVFEGLARAASSQPFVSGRDVVQATRITKSDKELALLERANLATKAALGVVARMSRPGMRESELRTLIRDAQAVAGLKNVWALVLFGPNAAFPHGTDDERTLAEGDFVLIDTGGQLHGYCSDITRTWPIGRVSDRSRRIFDTVLQAQRAAFERLGPGVRCEQVDAAARAVIEKAGFGADYAVFSHRLGHGIGLQGHEDPYLVRGNALVLQPGMTMSNEPGIYIPGDIGVRIEDIVAITDDGHRVFGSRVESIDAPV